MMMMMCVDVCVCVCTAAAQAVLQDEWVLGADGKAILIARFGDPAFYSFLTRTAGLPVWYPALGAPDARDPSVPLSPGERFRESLVKFMAAEDTKAMATLMNPGVCTCGCRCRALLFGCWVAGA